MWLTWLSWSEHAFAECTFRATPERLLQALEAAEGAYATLDVDEFRRAMTEVDFVVPCLDGPADVALAARLHRLRGLGRFADGDRPGAEASLRAARALAPDYTFSEELLPIGFELRDAYAALPVEPAPTERLPKPARGSAAWIDGRVTNERPVGVPTLWQILTEGDVKVTAYLDPADPTPWYPGANKDQVPWFVAAGVTAVCAGGAYAGAASVGRPITDPGPTAVFSSADEARSRQTTANVLVAVSAVLGAATVGELVGGVLAGGRP